MSNLDSDELSARLRAWNVDPPVPPSFPRAVWQRISVRQASRAASFWPRAQQWFGTQLIRPPYAAVLVAVSLLASLGAAYLQAQEANARHWKELESRYATSINPLAMTRSPGVVF